jgi:hypothetical protein
MGQQTRGAGASQLKARVILPMPLAEEGDPFATTLAHRDPLTSGCWLGLG